MHHVTEDTPPDMLAGAMDLTVHLPTGRSIKMSVERSTPMMDLLVQITTNNQLQLSNYTLQALGMAPCAGYGDKILPYKPNTPIGTLDTQHIRVVAKSRTLPAVKAAPLAGQLPFESTFRLKVHLPRNQLYVTRVSRNVQLEDIMKKVCEEKNLDPVKYELKHPANLDEILDPKSTLCDYQITEIYVVSKGTISLNQTFSTSDIMALRKEEERKQMHNKTGGGVFNLIFRRGKSSMGSGSISSDTRSISPTHSDDSRSVTPPSIQQPILTPPTKKEDMPERPKPPLRKRRPAPKPPQAPEGTRTAAEDARTTTEGTRTASGDTRRSSDRETGVVSEGSELRRSDNGLVICHSRNSSDSSGYHEASVLSEHCNTSLPRRPKSAFVGTGEGPKMHSQSVTNLSKMAAHSKSTTSLGMTGRKKKAAPPPPPAIRASNPSVHLEAPSPVVASQTTSTIETAPCTSQDSFLALGSDPVPFPRSKSKAPPVPAPRSDISRRVDLGNAANVEDASGEGESLRELQDASNFNGKKYLMELGDVIGSFNGENSRQKLYDATKSVNGKEVLKKLPDELESLKGRESSEELHNMKRGSKEEESRQHLRNSQETFEGKEYSEELISRKYLNGEESRQELYDATKSANGKESLKKLPNKLKSYNREESPKEMRNVKGGFNKEDSKQDLCDATKDLNGEKSRQELRNAQERFNEEESLEKLILPKDFNGEESTQDLRNISLNELYDATKGFNEVLKDYERQSTPAINNAREEIVLKTLLNGNRENISVILWGNESFTNKEVEGPEGPESPAKELEKLQLQLQHNLFTSVVFKPNQRKLPVDASVSQPDASADAPSNSNDKKLPEVVGVIPKILENKASQSKFDTFGKRRLQNLASLIDSFDDESKSLHGRADENKSNSLSSRTSLTSALGSLDCIDDLSDLDEKVFSRNSFGNNSSEKNVFNELCGIHDLEKVDLGMNQSISSLRSLRSLQGFANNGMRKWDNLEELDSQSLASLGPCGDGRWVVGDSQPASLTSHQTLDSLPSSDIIPDASEAKPFGSTDSGIATEKLEEEAGKEIFCPQEDLDWHYELPSPPRAFKDASPAGEDSKDSVVTSPELFEKLKTLEGEQKPQEDFKDSVVPSPELFDELKTSEDEQTQPLNTLSLEKLERRQSMVYHRVLSGMRMTEEVEEEERDTFTGSLSKFESTLAQVQTRFTPKANVQTLPNFKISTYDRPKQKIKVFEDDTVRSNSDKPADVLQRYPVGRSMESISARENSAGNEFTKSDGEYRPAGKLSGQIRSESFSQDYARGPARPVSRSKSHLTLDGAAKYWVDRRCSKDEGVSRSNSLYDVSGLQSLGVMRLIQTKLNIPEKSMENLAPQEQIYQPLPSPQPQREPPQEQSSPPKALTLEKPSVPDKVYKYSGPPAINMSTWSERPKVPVSVARDEDYTLGNHEDSRRFFTPKGYRKPQRPHSIASDLDISRVPVVRSVELKKPFRELVTHIHAPVVRGFPAHASGSKGGFATNSQVPFGQGTLRRTESSKIGEVWPSSRPDSGPPALPHVGTRKAAVRQKEPVADERDQLLSAIRNFGGKKGLKAVKAA